MNKLLVHSADEVVALVLKHLSHEESSRFLSIEFQLKDETGKLWWESDLEAAIDAESPDSKMLDRAKFTDVWRPVQKAYLPTSFPCVVLYSLGNTFDRTGDVTYRLLEYVEKEDFSTTSKPKRTKKSTKKSTESPRLSPRLVALGEATDRLLRSKSEVLDAVTEWASMGEQLRHLPRLSKAADEYIRATDQWYQLNPFLEAP